MIEAELIEKRTAKDYGLFKFKLKEKLKDPDAGQFVMLKSPDEPILAKPFSIYSYKNRKLTLFIKRVGRLTGKVFSSPIGEVFYVRGPYGIPYIKKIDRDKKYILIGGGSGVAPLNFFSELYPELVYKKLYGFKGRYIRELFEEQSSLVIEEESGKTVVDVLREVYSEGLGVLACGPIPMLKTLPPGSYVSLESVMGCGIGTCKSCAVKTKEGIKMVCKDGPLFRKEEIQWEWI
ncbi:MAG: Dihydroorotate dehydrogenase electron transfer subunit [Thermococcales archaeon 44_46]|uniref:iron-sulfur cluster-binding protein n=1 Tax=Thermococcus sp. PK TaxID=913025 RepID=UPI0005B2D979|nr:dihydroorotate dehydrogenase [Thermococcus sp. PK]KUK00199.1 MAG: Dihydroorotate dehydrogenase electron transfer subunit [Thermococcales archaeon 44_46]HIH71774.1 dihydroorotate dehydrogenase [Thermococcaceae archaeon]